MATVEEHYRTLLGGVYSWMFGGFESGVNKFVEFFDEMSIRPKGNGIAIDLGAGCGFQAIPLARLGFTVTAIDLDATLLEELKDNSENHPINVVQGDIVEFDKLNIQDVELIVCMTDTLIHLESTDMVCSLFDKAQSALQIGGKFVITFRDLTHELSNLDRFIHVKGDSERILTCFLEYEPDSVKVHDIVYTNENGEWLLSKSYYRKLRLSEQQVIKWLKNAGFGSIISNSVNGLVTIVATK